MKVLKNKDFKSMPWKNNCGTTLELFRDTSEGDFNLRLSIAKVKKDAAFSLYPNLTRHLLILNGNGCELKLDSQRIILTQENPTFTFSGNDSIFCTLLNGSITDFNVMINPKWAEAVISKNDSSFIYDGDLNFIYDTDFKTLTLFQRFDKVENKGTNYISVKIKKAGSLNAAF